MKFILAIESSCDDTSVAVSSVDYDIISLVTSSQPEHIEFGGVLPELASRLHMKNLMFLVEHALVKADLTLNDISAVAVSINPGLIGSLIVGLAFAKSLAWGLGIPCITVNHMLGHVFANHIEHKDIELPFLALIVSGGHTELVLFKSETDFRIIGKTLDDAAGETFDKIAKIMKLGYPGGPFIDKLAMDGNRDFVVFPRALKRKDDYNFSYSGLKTAVLQFVDKQTPEWLDANKPDLAASVQAAIIDPLINKTTRFARLNNIKTILLAGGVAANSALRNQLQARVKEFGGKLYYPSLPLCMDNAAMIAAAAIHKFNKRQFAPLDINAFSDKGTRLL